MRKRDTRLAFTPAGLQRARCHVSPTGAHHWRIETPQGATSPAACVHCEATREYSNIIQNEQDQLSWKELYG